MDGLFMGPKRSYEDFKRQIPVSVFAVFDVLRQYCISLGDNVVEDVRAHRIVFGKSISFRWFADLEPENNAIIVKVQRDRKEPFKTITITNETKMDELKDMILDAYNMIR